MLKELWRDAPTSRTARCAIRLSSISKIQGTILCLRFDEKRGVGFGALLDPMHILLDWPMYTNQLVKEQQEHLASFWWCGSSAGNHRTSCRPQSWQTRLRWGHSCCRYRVSGCPCGAKKTNVRALKAKRYHLGFHYSSQWPVSYSPISFEASLLSLSPKVYNKISPMKSAGR